MEINLSLKINIINVPRFFYIYAREMRNTVSITIYFLVIPHFFTHYLVCIVLVDNGYFLPAAGNESIMF
ncbi:hypothetical protein Xmir_03009 [Xenorhabdus miraniensis]|uniref:Uncharacterized protein n=2 Tax=Xenorhabdus TaxID=626 RepID=A0A2D0JMZ8_9GAMM|nr:hypothetical protein Xmir_03009 [Xenorhabdus miraniensis]PHM63348.1 hypothetical protein Xish_02591 [Xenorhabdus ishibashii]